MYKTDELRIRQNLIDAGCDNDAIDGFFEISGDDIFSKRIGALQCHRKKLLENIHKRQHQLDCLDYLIMQLEKNNTKYQNERR